MCVESARRRGRTLPRRGPPALRARPVPRTYRAPKRRSQAGRQGQGLAQTAPSKKARAFGRDGLCASVSVEVFGVILYRTYPVLTGSRNESWSSRRPQCGYPVSRTGHRSAHGTRSCMASHLGGTRQATRTHFSNDRGNRSREREGEAVNLERLRRSRRLQRRAVRLAAETRLSCLLHKDPFSHCSEDIFTVSWRPTLQYPSTI